MKEVAERLQMPRRLQMHATSDGENDRHTHSYGGSPSAVLPADEMAYGSVGTSELVLSE